MQYIIEFLSCSHICISVYWWCKYEYVFKCVNYVFQDVKREHLGQIVYQCVVVLMTVNVPHLTDIVVETPVFLDGKDPAVRKV